MVNLELYRIFYEVASCGSISLASKSLNVSQPAVTKQIKNLEEQLGTLLFVRTRKGVLLTSSGEQIYLDVKNALTILDNIEQNINQINHKGVIRIGVSASLTRLVLLDYINSFHKKYSDVDIKIINDTTKEHIKKLQNGLLDVVICKMPVDFSDDMYFTKLGETRYTFVGSKEYYDKIKQPVFIGDLVKYPILLQNEPSNSYYSAIKYFKQNYINTSSPLIISSSSLLIDFAKIGYGVAYVTKLYVKKELESHELYEIRTMPRPPKVSYGILTLKNSVKPLIVEEFISHIKNASK